MNLETPRLLIRDFTPADADDLHDILGDGETMANAEPPYSREKTRAFLTSFCIDRHGAVAAVQKATGKLIGYILFHDQGDGVYEMGWFFHRSYWRQGYAYEACKAVIDHAFGELHAHKIFAETIDSVKSTGLMKKLGMQQEGIQHSQTKDLNGHWVDLYLYGLCKADWEAAPWQSPADAVHLARRAADRGDCDGQYNLARFHEDGIGVARDMEQATFWYRKAALQGHDLAIIKCRALGVDLNSPTVDREAIRKELQCRIYPLGVSGTVQVHRHLLQLQREMDLIPTQEAHHLGDAGRSY